MGWESDQESEVGYEDMCARHREVDAMIAAKVIISLCFSVILHHTGLITVY